MIDQNSIIKHLIVLNTPKAHLSIPREALKQRQEPLKWYEATEELLEAERAKGPCGQVGHLFNEWGLLLIDLKYFRQCYLCGIAEECEEPW